MRHKFVPISGDTDKEVENKVKETLTMGELFLKWLGDRIQRFVGVVQGRTAQQVIYAARNWKDKALDEHFS